MIYLVYVRAIILFHTIFYYIVFAIVFYCFPDPIFVGHGLTRVLYTTTTKMAIQQGLLLFVSVIVHCVFSFEATGATIEEALTALSSGEVSCVQMIQMHLDRIAAYDQAGPVLNAIV